MNKPRILTVMAAASLLLPLIISCSRVTDGRDPSVSGGASTPGGTTTPGYIFTAKPKTPTPQAEFDPGKYPDKPQNPQNPGQTPGIPDNDVPRYEVDFIPDPLLEGYTSLVPMFESLFFASDGVAPEEQPINLFDGYESSKYCIILGGATEIEVIWSMDSELPVSAYALATGNDTGEYPDRNPISWELYGSSEGPNGEWELIDAVENPDMPAANYAYKGFALEENVRYRYFRIVLHANKGQTYIQLSELRLYTDDPAAAGFADSEHPQGARSLFELIDRSTITGPASAGNHTVGDLFDNLARSSAGGSNKYCPGGSDITVEWRMKEAVVITDYVVYTANDTEIYPDRNPVRWTLYGSTDGENYEVVHEVADSGLPVANYTPTAYSTGCTAAYSYYRLEMHTAAGAGALQLSEICLFTRNTDE